MRIENNAYIYNADRKDHLWFKHNILTSWYAEVDQQQVPK